MTATHPEEEVRWLIQMEEYVMGDKKRSGYCMYNRSNDAAEGLEQRVFASLRHPSPRTSDPAILSEHIDSAVQLSGAIASAIKSSSRALDDAWVVVKQRTMDEDAFRRVCSVSLCAGEMLNRCAEAPSVFAGVKLGRRSVQRLGFESKATLAQICARIDALGFGLCPDWIVVPLRGQYRQQPKGEFIRVAMASIADAKGLLGIFSLGHDAEGLRLGWSNGDPRAVYDLEQEFIYVIPG